jgi:hypothetical protein
MTTRSDAATQIGAAPNPAAKAVRGHASARSRISEGRRAGALSGGAGEAGLVVSQCLSNVMLFGGRSLQRAMSEYVTH